MNSIMTPNTDIEAFEMVMDTADGPLTVHFHTYTAAYEYVVANVEQMTGDYTITRNIKGA